MKQYGFDRLSRDLLILSVVCGAIAACTFFTWAGPILSAVAAVLALAVLLRAVSDKKERRQDELLGYERVTEAVKGFFSRLFGHRNGSATREAGYKYFKCPACGQQMRAPKGRGRIRVTCSGCGNVFERNV